MNGAVLLITGIALYVLAYIFYGRYLSRLFGIDPQIKTPSHTRNDGVDYVPSKAPVLFGHHFASIAGAGPIVGPVLGACFGWLPAALWIVLGCIFVGAAHDFAALFLSVRNEGRSIGHIIEKHISRLARQIFLLFCFATLVLVVAIFAILVAKTFVNAPSVATSSLFFIGIAPPFGYLVHKKHVSLFTGSLIFVPLLFVGIYAGMLIPLDLAVLFNVSAASARNIWLFVLFIYVFIASVIPVWTLLQPRDYLNSYLLYVMIIVGFFSIVIAAPEIKMPAFTGFVVSEPTKGAASWPLFPILFVTVACGAISGFHSLVSSGTTAKQVSSEKDLLGIGFGGMLLEGAVALMALISVCILTREGYLSALAEKGAVSAFAGGLAGLSAKIGLPLKAAETFIALTISAFMLTTLDTATRLTRFAVQEIFHSGESVSPEHPFSRFFHNRYTATTIVVLISGYLAFSGDAGKLWPVFGASNQLLAALTLLLVTVILIKRKVNYWVVLIPFVLMISITIWALIALFLGNIRTGNWTLVGATAFLLIMSGTLIIQSTITCISHKNSQKEF